MKRWKWMAAIAVAGVLASSAALAGTVFEDLGDFTPIDCSDDGTVVVGTIGSSAGRWTPGDGLQNIGGLGGSVSVSADGLTIAGNTTDRGGLETAGYWTEGNGWTSIGGVTGAVPCDGDLSSAYGISGDGSVIVGLAWLPELCDANGFRWNQTDGMVGLGTTVPDRSTRANAISDDEQLIVGWQDAPDGFRQGARWENDVQTLFVGPGGAQVGEAQNTNNDGSVVVGGSLGPNAWRWSGGPEVESIGMLPGFNFRSIAADLSNDGSVVVGFAGFGIDRDAFIYTDDLGIQRLDDFLLALGVTDAAGWDLGTATACSADGNVIVGWGFAPPPGPLFRGWRIDLNALPTPVELARLEAVAVPNGVRLDWTVSRESGVAGFHVLRELDGERVQLTEQLIRSSGERDYTFADRSATRGETYAYYLEALDLDGTRETHGPALVTVPHAAPKQVALAEARPNPFNPSTTISFEVATPGSVVMQVFDSTGRLVRTLVDENLAAASHTVDWDGRSDSGVLANSGVYIYRLETGGEVLSRKMTLLK